MEQSFRDEGIIGTRSIETERDVKNERNFLKVMGGNVIYYMKYLIMKLRDK